MRSSASNIILASSLSAQSSFRAHKLLSQPINFITMSDFPGFQATSEKDDLV